MSLYEETAITCCYVYSCFRIAHGCLKYEGFQAAYLPRQIYELSISSISPTRYAFTFGAHSYDSGTSISSTMPSLGRSTRGTCNMLVYASSGRSIARLRCSSTNQSWNTAKRSKLNSPGKHCRIATCALPGCTLRERRRLPKLSVCDTL
jgi:hypothetical protein